jgi:hypothetical protein
MEVKTADIRSLAKGVLSRSGNSAVRNWPKRLNYEQVRMMISAFVAVLGFCLFVVFWSAGNIRGECFKNCSTDISSNRR